MFSILMWVAATAFVVALATTPLVRAVAPVLGLIDRPDARRKLHRRAVPLGGGLAVLVATVTATGVGLALTGVFQRWLPGDVSELSGLVAAAALITAVGLIDDAYA